MEKSREQTQRGSGRLSSGGVPGFATCEIRSVLRASEDSAIPRGHLELRQSERKTEDKGMAWGSLSGKPDAEAGDHQDD